MNILGFGATQLTWFVGTYLLTHIQYSLVYVYVLQADLRTMHVSIKNHFSSGRTTHVCVKYVSWASRRKSYLHWALRVHTCRAARTRASKAS